MTHYVRVVTKEQSATGWGILLDTDSAQMAATTPCCDDVLTWNRRGTAQCVSCRKKYPPTVKVSAAGPSYDFEQDFILTDFHEMRPGEDWRPWLSAVTGLPEEAFTVVITD